MGVSKRLNFFADGAEAVAYLTQLIDGLDMEKVKDQRVIQPVSLILLEINMTGQSGFDVNKQIKRIYDSANQRLSSLKR